jgi:metal-sulfur cluster biosynthetic enzyme
MVTELTPTAVFEQIRPVKDPELRMGIVDLGLVYDARIEGGRVTVVMTLTSPGCPFAPEIEFRVKEAVAAMEGVEEAAVEFTFNPPWNPAEMASDDVKDELGIW